MPRSFDGRLGPVESTSDGSGQECGGTRSDSCFFPDVFHVLRVVWVEDDADDAGDAVLCATSPMPLALGEMDSTSCCRTIGWCSGWKAVLTATGEALSTVKWRVGLGAERRAFKMEDMAGSIVAFWKEVVSLSGRGRA